MPKEIDLRDEGNLQATGRHTNSLKKESLVGIYGFNHPKKLRDKALPRGWLKTTDFLPAAVEMQAAGWPITRDGFQDPGVPQGNKNLLGWFHSGVHS